MHGWRVTIGLRGAAAASMALALAVTLAGCKLTGPAELTHRTQSEQNEAILAIVPYGTTRDQAVDILERAGVQGEFGVSQSVYYCDLWNRDDGQLWRLDVALFFDQSGRLYKIGPSQGGGGTASSTAEAARPTNGDSTAADVSSGTGVPAGRMGRRTPFADPDSLR